MAKVYYGDEMCRRKLALLLAEMGLPDWLLPFDDINQFGYENDTGFVWLKRKPRREQGLEEIEGKIVFYEAEITCYLEPKRIRKLTGVKAKQLFIWISLSEIHVDKPSAGDITFKTTSGLSKSFALSEFAA
ncbi:uncharacterized protein LOC127799214 [Diospyros lotus]|uniref:uncharacterized protein LOC127799214 n=1 Tax=Diospyros lotus TaxID=55363 RepID=UPI0022504939|nr:uncharacterized protein LOC127799214 [Diospyros lotus]